MIAEGYDAFLFDLDGVLYRASEPVPGAAEAVGALRALGKRLAFLTNNSARTPEEVAAHLRSVGVEAAPEEVETSALSTAGFLRARDVSTAFVVGERGLRDALSAAGVLLLDGEPDAADAVVVGWDRRVDYEKLRVASVLVQRGARLVASNADPSYPAPGGLAWPGAGAILAAIEATTRHPGRCRREAERADLPGGARARRRRPSARDRRPSRDRHRRSGAPGVGLDARADRHRLARGPPGRGGDAHVRRGGPVGAGRDVMRGRVGRPSVVRPRLCWSRPVDAGARHDQGANR